MAAGPNPPSIQTSLTAPLKSCQQAEPCEGTKPCVSGRHDDGWHCWTKAFGLTIFTANCGAAIYHSRNDPWAVVFVLSSYFILLSLFYMLRVFESLPRGSPRRAHAKATIWVLSTVLTLMFALRVAQLMPLPAAILVWVMAGSTISAGFFMFFVCPDGAVVAEEESPKVANMA